MKIFISNEVPKLPFRRAVPKPTQMKCVQIMEDFCVQKDATAQSKEETIVGKPGDWLIVAKDNTLMVCPKNVFKTMYNVIHVDPIDR